MTEIILFETSNWYAEGVAILPNLIANHPLIDHALEIISKENNFDQITYLEREMDFTEIFSFIDNEHSFSGNNDANIEQRETMSQIEIILDSANDVDLPTDDALHIIDQCAEGLKKRLDFLPA